MTSSTLNVVVYSGRLCTYCNAAKRLLDKKGVAYKEILIDEDPALREEMEQRSHRNTVPQIFIGETHVGGFDDLAELNREGKLDAMLGL
ncbi:MAG: glutaredoxin 3 [Pseudomonadota bacterium]